MCGSESVMGVWVFSCVYISVFVWRVCVPPLTYVSVCLHRSEHLSVRCVSGVYRSVTWVSIVCVCESVLEYFRVCMGCEVCILAGLWHVGLKTGMDMSCD